MERNRVTFDNEAPSAHRMKSFFLFTLWSWAKLYSIDNLNSLVGFLSWLGYIDESELVFPCTPLVYSLGALCSFFIYILLFTDQKKKKKDKVDRNLDTMYLAACLHASLGCQM